MEYKNYVAGEWVLSTSDETVPNENPANVDEVWGRVRLSTFEEVVGAVRAAAAAQQEWRQVPAPTRARLVDRARQAFAARAREAAELLTKEEGKVLSDAGGEVRKTINILEFMAGEGLRLHGETVPSELANNFAYTRREPIGVVGLITPWNFPYAIPFWKIAPALIAGNGIVWKPSEITPGCSQLVTECFAEAGCPAGLLNMVHGGAGTGQALVDNPVVRAISFTGSTTTGRKVYTQAAQHLKKVQCEMGGKNPIVVLDDADLELAALGAAQGAFGSTGQRCTATSRAIVMEEVADQFVEMVARHADEVVPGNGLEEGSTMGPSVSEEQLSKVLGYIELGQQEGATLVRGGERLKEGGLDKGYFVAPTIFDGVSPEMRIAREEIFGPVLSVIRVADLDEAIEVANNVDYGLTSSVYSRDAGRIFQFIDRIETGITHANSPTMGGEAQLPFGGMKDTNVGPREMHRSALEFFSNTKTVYIDYTGTGRKSKIY